MPTSPEDVAGYVFVGIAAFLLGVAVTALTILLRRKKHREVAGRDRDC